MLRFAPSPTGDLHIGDLRVALFNYIVSKQKKEDFIIRIEDTDTQKNIEGKDREILDLVDLFGLEHSQVVYQSQNVRFHSAMALQLMHEKKAFSCFCSWEWIEGKRKEAEDAGKEYQYDDACRDLPAELVIDNLSPFTIRLKRPDKDITINDHIKGYTTFKADSVDSFMLLAQDKTSRYIFASAVDDMLNDISLVVRDEANINNTPKQEHVRASLKYDKKLEYAHIPSISNLDDALNVKELLTAGYLPAAISNYLISMGNDLPHDIFETKDAIEWFDFSMVSNSPTRFDIEELKEINKKHLLQLDSKELSRYVGFADEEIGELARLYLEEVSTTKELKTKIEPIFASKEIPQEFIQQVKLMKDAIKSAPYFNEYDAFKDYISKETGLDGDDFVKPLHLLLTGTVDGPEIAEIYKYLKNYIGEIIK